MGASRSYIVVDPQTVFGLEDREELTEETQKELVSLAHRMFVGLFQKEPEETPFWCYGYDVACAGPIP